MLPTDAANGPTAALAVSVAGGVMIVGILASPRHGAGRVHRLMVVTYPVGCVISTAAPAAVFYLVFTPIGWAMRLTGRDPLRLRTQASAPSGRPVTGPGRREQTDRSYFIGGSGRATAGTGAAPAPGDPVGYRTR
jgi:hypothetical protein